MSGELGAGISVVCVYNNPAVRAECLDASIAAYSGPVDVDYVPVDNTERAFSSAGAALNHGARAARHDVVVFVHQDVWLHDVDRLAAVGRHLEGDTWHLLGASGVDAAGRSIGRLRDRVQVIGTDADVPVPVESLDEVLFLVRRDRILADPLAEDPDLAWHAYAVEYALRLREQGRGVGAVNAAITHNSLTVNLDRLDVAHRRVAAMHESLLPAQTTCGVIGEQEKDWRDLPGVRRHKWRLRWLRNSLVARRLARSTAAPIVIADIRLDVDLLPHEPGAPLHVVNVDRAGGFAPYDPEVLTLTRYDRPVHARTVTTRGSLLAALADIPDGETVLVTDLAQDDVAAVAAHGGRRWLVGVHEGEPWLLRDPTPTLPPTWTEPRARPLGLPAAAR